MTEAPSAAKLPWFRRLVLGYVRRELPGWGRLYARCGGNDDGAWRDLGVQQVCGKLHGFVMELDLGNWSERLSWFLGRYHDLLLQQVLQRVLRPGDCFVDIGANLGMVTLLARSAVGDAGRVLACEPNPTLGQRLERTLAQNGLRNVELVRAALSDGAGTAELHVFDDHSGWGSLSEQGPTGATQTAAWQVDTRPGDELLAALPANQPMVIKIDVEGHEVPVLRGLQRTLRERRPLVLCEVVDAHQRRAGYSAAQLRAELEQHGYRAFVIGCRRRWLFGHEATLTPLVGDPVGEVDVLFVPPDGPLAGRV
ncbi:MAG: FkbM family methyltransferase [Planctomycetes bacterium]|nr:FkbM family methyltransferase [Planctomycetota bacterium]